MISTLYQTFALEKLYATLTDFFSFSWILHHSKIILVLFRPVVMHIEVEWGMLWCTWTLHLRMGDTVWLPKAILIFPPDLFLRSNVLYWYACRSCLPFTWLPPMLPSCKYARVCARAYKHAALLRYSWRTALCKFKTYGVIIWYTHILWNDYHSEGS